MVLGSFILGNVVKLYTNSQYQPYKTPNYGNKWLCIGTYIIVQNDNTDAAQTISQGYLNISILGPNSTIKIDSYYNNWWITHTWQSVYAIQLS